MDTIETGVVEKNEVGTFKKYNKFTLKSSHSKGEISYPKKSSKIETSENKF